MIRRNRLTNSHLVTALLLTGLILTGGCGFKGLFPAKGNGGDEQAVWQPVAVSMQVQPSIRYVEESGVTTIEATVELRDEMGDPIKQSGEYRFELMGPSRQGKGGSGQLLSAWPLIAVVTLEQHQLRYDDIARAYRFKLELDRLPHGLEVVKLVVTFIAADGQRLTTDIDIKR